MKLNDLKVVYICPDHNDKYRARKEHMDGLLASIGFTNIEHFKSSTEDYPDCLSKATMEILTKYMEEPVLILEDDVDFTGINEFNLPEGADAIYFGLSIAGGHAIYNHADGPSRYTAYSESQVRIQNMLATHAVLYISPAYKKAVIKIISEHRGQRYPMDVLIARLQPHFFILANKNPSFYQSSRFNIGSEEYYTRINFNKPLTNTISCGLAVVGRLGNHMFQIAALVRHCLVYNKDIRIYVDNHGYYKDGPLYRCKQFITQTPIQNNVGGIPFHYVPIPEDADTLYGYFQSSQYFSDISGHIRALFAPSPEITAAVETNYGSYVSADKTVALHVRRGDYIAGANANIHGILTPLYYRAAMALCRERLGPDTKFLILSDDIEYCRSTYGSDTGVTCVDEPDTSMALHFMSQFQNYILSNSTFCWWAAYLGKPATLVVAPDPWFGPAGPKDYQDIYEPEWIRITAQ